MADLDLTSAARDILESLSVRDSDELALKSVEDIWRACTSGAGGLWNEITRVLEGLGYEVSKRANAAYWW